MKIFGFIVFILIRCLSFGQSTEYELQEIRVNDSLSRKTGRILTLKRETILELQAEDAGQLLQKFPGVAIRSYGGLGGMKTISVRSLGSQHSSIVVDGFTMNNTQTGQVNLGQIQSENIESIQLVLGSQKSFLVPSSVQVSGSAILIETFENTFSSSKNQVRFASKTGSFGQFDNYLSYKYCKKRLMISAFGKYRFSNGQYPYSFQNGQSLYTGIRTNNNFSDSQGGIAFGFKTTEQGILSIAVKKDFTDQELPGAVILYAQYGSQTLKTGNDRIQMAYSDQYKKLNFRFFGTFQKMRLNYTDTSFLNAVGEIKSIYDNTLLQVGANVRWSVKDKMVLFGSTEEQISNLTANTAGFGIPERFHNFTIVGLNYNFDFLKITSQLSTQVIEENNLQIKRATIVKYNPFVQIDSKEFGDKYKMQLTSFYRNSFRMPSFNELYYNNIGNILLKPENADQISLGYTLFSTKSKLKFSNRSSVYFNQVRNKIVAIPTKNLFVWSMQNIGKVNIFGLETNVEISFAFSKFWEVTTSLNYTFQQAQDITSNASPTFQHQIAYIPKQSGNADFTLKRKQTGLRISNFSNSMRYSLNENIQANEVSGFWITDVSIFTKLPIKKHDFRLQLSCKNCLNTSYSIVRYYVMPGRNYLISLNYALK